MYLRKFIQITLLFCLLVIINSSCKKHYFFSADELPAETQIGAQTFGFMIDNRVWLPKSNNLTPARTLSFFNNKLYITASKGNEYMRIDFANIIAEGKYSLLVGNNNIEYIVSDSNYNISSLNYKCILGSIDITKIDGIKRIISGRFNFLAEDQNTKKVVNVTDGRFDFKY